MIDCNNIDVPINADAIIDALENLRFIPDSDLVDAADRITESLVENANLEGVGFKADVKASIDTNFIKLIIQGLVTAILSPKILLPIYIMLEAIGRPLLARINSWVDFTKQFSRFVINFVSKVGAIFVEELFLLIKKDLLNLIRSVILDLQKEKNRKKLRTILRLIQILTLLAQLVSDFRKCKSVIDEILALLKVALTGFGGEVPLPLLAAARLLDGYSETRAFISTIEELQKLGIPTGDLPDGSPNVGVLSFLGQMKAMADENAENGKSQIFIPPLAVAGFATQAASGFGKSF